MMQALLPMLRHRSDTFGVVFLHRRQLSEAVFLLVEVAEWAKLHTVSTGNCKDTYAAT